MGTLFFLMRFYWPGWFPFPCLRSLHPLGTSPPARGPPRDSTAFFSHPLWSNPLCFFWGIPYSFTSSFFGLFLPLCLSRPQYLLVFCFLPIFFLILVLVFLFPHSFLYLSIPTPAVSASEVHLANTLILSVSKNPESQMS